MGLRALSPLHVSFFALKCLFGAHCGLADYPVVKTDD